MMSKTKAWEDTEEDKWYNGCQESTENTVGKQCRNEGNGIQSRATEESLKSKDCI